MKVVTVSAIRPLYALAKIDLKVDNPMSLDEIVFEKQIYKKEIMRASLISLLVAVVPFLLFPVSFFFGWLIGSIILIPVSLFSRGGFIQPFLPIRAKVAGGNALVSKKDFDNYAAMISERAFDDEVMAYVEKMIAINRVTPTRSEITEFMRHLKAKSGNKTEINTEKATSENPATV